MMNPKQDNNMTSRIDMVFVKNETELPYRLNRVLFMKKTRQDNDMTNSIGLVYFETKTELSGPL